MRDLAQALPDTHFLTLFWASRAASVVESDNQISLFSAFLDLADSRPVAPLTASDVFRIKFAFVQEMARRKLMTVAEQLNYVQLMTDDIANEPNVSEYATRFYTAYEGYLLRVNGSSEDAFPKQMQFHEYLTEREIFRGDYDSNAYRMMRTVLDVKGRRAAYAFISEVVEKLEASGRSPTRLAVYHRNLAALASRLKQRDLSQEHMRTAYRFARKERRANDPFVRRIADKIRTDSPGLRISSLPMNLVWPETPKLS